MRATRKNQDVHEPVQFALVAIRQGLNLEHQVSTVGRAEPVVVVSLACCDSLKARGREPEAERHLVLELDFLGAVKHLPRAFD